MEEERSFSTAFPDSPRQNGDHDDVSFETPFDPELTTDKSNGEGPGHEADRWEEAPWSTRPLTGSAASLSFATVQWNLPDAGADSEADGILSHEILAGHVPLQRPQNLLSQLHSQPTTEGDGVDFWTSTEMNGDHIKTCDAAEEEEQQKREGLLHESTDEDDDDGVWPKNTWERRGRLSDVETVLLADILEEADVEEEADVPPKRRSDAEKELISVNGVHTCGESEDEEGGILNTWKSPQQEDTSEAPAVIVGQSGSEEGSQTLAQSEIPGNPTVGVQGDSSLDTYLNMTGNLGDQKTAKDVSNRSTGASIKPDYLELEDVHAGDKSAESAQVGPKQPLEQLRKKTHESGASKHLSSESEVTQMDASKQVDPVADSAQTNGGTVKRTDVPHMNGHEGGRESARGLAERLFKLDGVRRVDVVKHMDKDNDYSRAVGEEYLGFFDFAGETLDQALRSFLQVIVLIGETQERERVLQHFSGRFHQCNPDAFSSSGAVLALTCALMLLNTDLHGQNVGKSMSSSQFVSNLDGMNNGENFSKDMLKSLYNAIKGSPLKWAVDDDELKSSVLGEQEAGEDATLRSKSNPFQDLPHDKTAPEVKQGFLLRKIHADIDGKRTPWGKRSWRTFYGVLKGMVLYLKKDDYKPEQQQVNEEAVSVHHSLAEQAVDYTKKPHVFRLQTADWRVFLFQASSKMEMNSWISRINLVSALRSSPPFPAAVGSQRRFCRPILPASQCADTLDRQLQSAAGMLQSFQVDLSHLQQPPPEGRRAKAKELEENRVRAQYLQHEMCRYQNYIYVLESWKKVKETEDGTITSEDLDLFEKVVSVDLGSEEGEGGLKKSHSSPSLELEMVPPSVISVRRNISERRTYRRPMVSRWNKEA